MLVSLTYIFVGATLLVQPLARATPMFLGGQPGIWTQSSWPQQQQEFSNWPATNSYGNIPPSSHAYGQPSNALTSYPSLHAALHPSASPSNNLVHRPLPFGNHPALVQTYPAQNDGHSQFSSFWDAPPTVTHRDVNEMHSSLPSNSESDRQRPGPLSSSRLYSNVYSAPSPTPEEDEEWINSVVKEQESDLQGSDHSQSVPRSPSRDTGRGYSTPSPTPEKDEEWINSVIQEQESDLQGSDHSQSVPRSPSRDTGRGYSTPSPTPEEDEEWNNSVVKEQESDLQGSVNRIKKTRERSSRNLQKGPVDWRPAITVPPEDTSAKVLWTGGIPTQHLYHGAEPSYFHHLDYLQPRDDKLARQHMNRRDSPIMRNYINEKVFKGKLNWVPLAGLKNLEKNLRKTTPFKRRYRRLPLVAAQAPEKFGPDAWPVYFTDHLEGYFLGPRKDELGKKALYSFWVLPKRPGTKLAETHYFGTGTLDAASTAEVDAYIRKAVDRPVHL